MTNDKTNITVTTSFKLPKNLSDKINDYIIKNEYDRLNRTRVIVKALYQFFEAESAKINNS